MQVVGTFAWLLAGAMARPGAAQEPDPTAVVPSITQPFSSEEAVQTTQPATWSGRTEVYPLSDVVLESIFSKPDPNSWRPLTFSSFFSEGWFEPWVPSPNGSGGAPRQGWINAADGNFYRLGFFSFSYGYNRPPKGNAYLGAYTLYTPLSRRLLLITNIPFTMRNSAASGLPIVGPSPRNQGGPKSLSGFGDISFTPRVLVHETQDFSFTAELSVLTPTGTRGVAGHAALTPAVQFWNNFAGGWVLRGGLGDFIPTNGGHNDLIGQLAIGQTLTGHDVPLFGDFTYYLSTVVNADLVDADMTKVSLTSGMRTHLGRDWYFLAALDVPVAKARAADLGYIFWFMKAW
jgi:hypothetical protein